MVWKIGSLLSHGLERFLSFCGHCQDEARMLGQIALAIEKEDGVNIQTEYVSQAERMAPLEYRRQCACCLSARRSMVWCFRISFTSTGFRPCRLTLWEVQQTACPMGWQPSADHLLHASYLAAEIGDELQKRCF